MSETFCLRKDAEAWGRRIERDLGLEISPAARKRDARSGGLAAICSGVSALIWARRGPVGNTLVRNRYFPDAVATLADLSSLASELGMATSLDKMLTLAGAQTAY